MITEILLSGLRGVRDGLLTDLGPLVVFVGPNGCGKSTVLDSLLIGAGNNPGDAIGRTIRRRPYSWNGARWLFSRYNEERTATIGIKRLRNGAEEERSTVLSWTEAPQARLVDLLSQAKRREPYCGVSAEIHHPKGRADVNIGLAADNSYIAAPLTGEPIRGWEMRLVDSAQGNNQPIDDVFAAAVESGRREVAEGALRAVLGDEFRQLVSLPDNNVPVLQLEYSDGSVPVSLAGDGVASLVRIALELAGRPRGVVLLEEPEAHQHPRILWQTASLIWATIGRGVQIFLTTHSLELIDALIARAPQDSLPKLSLYRLKLAAGELISTRVSGDDAASMRIDFEDDLR